MRKFTIIICVLVLFSACENRQTIMLEHLDKKQVISCNVDLDPLLNEALYVFEENLTYLNTETMQNVNLGYSKFMYRAFEGSLKYDSMVSKQALEIRRALYSKGILINNGKNSNLNYKHPIINCLLENMTDRDMSNTITSLIDTQSMNPKLFSSRLIDFGKVAEEQRYLALFVALDGYYQNLNAFQDN